MLGTGFLGYYVKRMGFSVIPLAMGIILGGMLETDLKQSMIIFSHDWLRFLDRPIALVLFALAILGAFSSHILNYVNRQRDRRLAASEVTPS
jgi:putative tricarboxylic transport membrane protein